MAFPCNRLRVGARRIGTLAIGSRRRKAALVSLTIGLAAIGGCRNDLTRQNIESDRFLDQYAAGRGLTRDQARDEVAAKVKERETEQMMENAENAGTKVR
jgi:hypothetical protein